MATQIGRTDPAVKQTLRERLPGWVLEPLSDATIDTLDQWISASDWATREALVRLHMDGLLSDHGRELDLALILYPEIEQLEQLHELVAQIRAHGDAESVLAAQRDLHAHQDALVAWLTTRTWQQSRQIARENPGLLTDPRTLGFLQAVSESPAGRQHLAIIRLATTRALGDIDDIYDSITDHIVAADQAMACLDRLDLGTLDDLLLAAPDLASTPFTGAYLLAVSAALRPDHPHHSHASSLIDRAAAEGTSTQRSAGALRLRRIAAREISAAALLTELARRLEPNGRDGTR